MFSSYFHFYRKKKTKVEKGVQKKWKKMRKIKENIQFIFQYAMRNTFDNFTRKFSKVNRNFSY